MLWWMLACLGADKDDDDDNEEEESTESAPTGEDTGFPDDPGPLSLEVSGDFSGTLDFDSRTCTWLETVPNFRTFWRDSTGGHVFVLIAEILGSFEGPGAYDQSMGTVRVKLQEEAGGQNRYFATEGADTVSIVVTGIEGSAADGGRAWGQFEASGLADGGVSISPMPVPIWCPELL